MLDIVKSIIFSIVTEMSIPSYRTSRSSETGSFRSQSYTQSNGSILSPSFSLPSASAPTLSPSFVLPSTNILTLPPAVATDITTSEIYKAHDHLRDYVSEPKTIEFIEQIKTTQEAEENQLIKSTTFCDVPMLKSLRDHMSGLQSSELKELTTRQFYNAAAMKAAMCTVDSLFYEAPSDKGSLYLNSRIREYIRNLRQIGPESASGYALLGDFNQTKDLFIAKVSRDPSEDDLLHELIVGLYGTNRLRSLVPNFSYIYGGFKCSPPLIDPESKKVVTWCLNSDNAVNYVLYENITPSISMGKYLEKCTGKDFLNMYLQVIYALRLANSIVDFTHYDLHQDNVLIRDIPKMKNFQIVYETERGIEFLTTKHVATFIDYGMSHIQVPETGQHFGASYLIPYSVYPYRSWIMHDCYKFFMFCMSVAIRASNLSVLDEGLKIFHFFNKVDDFFYSIRTQKEIFYCLPITSVTEQFTIDNLMHHVRSVCNCDFISKQRSEDPILDCEHLCPTEEAVLDRIGLNPDLPLTVPDTVIGFYDLSDRLYNENRERERQAIGEAFQYRQAMENHVRKMNTSIRDLRTLRRESQLIDISDMDLNDLIEYDTMITVRTMYVNVASMVDKIADLHLNHDIGGAVARVYDDEAGIKILDNIMDQAKAHILPDVDNAKLTLLHNSQYLNELKEVNPKIERVVKKIDPRLLWYWNGRNFFDMVLGLQ